MLKHKKVQPFKGLLNLVEKQGQWLMQKLGAVRFEDPFFTD